MNLAIVTPEYGVYSESFVKAHYQLLPFNNLFFHRGKSLGLPTTLGENKSLLKGGLLLRVADKIQGKNRWHTSRVEKAFVKHKINVVLAEYGPMGAHILSICKKLNLPLIVHFHGYDASVHKVLNSYKDLYVEMFDYAKAIIVVSKPMKQRLLDAGAPEEKLILNTYGPDETFFDNVPSYKENKLVALGRFVDKKAPYLTILSFSHVLNDYPDAKLIMGGDGLLLNTCKNLVTALGIQDSVEFAGIMSPKQYREELETARAFIQHSVIADNGDMEGTPVAIIEALASGIPVIATRHAGIPEVVIDGETGLLVDEFDVDAMASKIKKLFEDKRLAERLGTNGRNRIRDSFTMRKHIDILANLIIKAHNEKIH